MVACEMCGNEVASLIEINVEGSKLKVCSNCKSVGVVVDKTYVEKSHTFSKKIKFDENSKLVVENYISIINSTLAKRGLNFHQLAKGVNIKESSLTKYLSGKIKLDVDTAIRIGRFLEISIIESSKPIDESAYSNLDVEISNSGSLGDLIRAKLEGKK